MSDEEYLLEESYEFEFEEDDGAESADNNDDYQLVCGIISSVG